MSTKTYYSSFFPSESGAGSKGSAAFLSTANTFIVYLYKRSATVLLDADKPNGDVIYTFNPSNINTTAVTNGWTSTIPTGTDELYLVGATATGTDIIDTILPNEWTTPALLGSSGTDGLSNATVFLFQRNNTGTAPAVPSTTTTYTFATGILSGTYTGWSQTAPDSAGGKYLYITTATAISATATDTIPNTEWATVRILAQDGADGYTAYLTNESHTVPATFAGVVSSYTGATGSFIVLKNNTDVSSNFTLSTVSNPQTLTVAYSTNTYTISGGLDTGEDSATLTIRATGSGTYAGVTIDKVFSLGKSKGGADGSPAKLMVIYSDKQAFTLNGDGAYVPSGQYITFTTTKQNTSAVVNWTTSPAVTIKDTSGNPTTTGDVIRIYATDTGANTAIEITATLTDGSTITDKITVVKVQDGTNSITGSLTNESHNVVAATDGTGYDVSTAGGTFKVYKGTTDVTTSSAFSGTTTQNGLTLTINATTGVYTLSGASWTSNSEVFTLTATYNTVVITKIYSITKSKTGAKGTDSITGMLTNEVYVTSALNDGTGYTLTAAGGTFKVYSGITDVTTSATFSGTSTQNGLTFTIGAASGAYTLSGASWTTDKESFTVTAVYGGVTITKVYSISKAKSGAGTSGINGMLSSDSVNIFTYADGTPVNYTSTAGYFRIYSGNTDVTTSATGFSVVASGCSGTVNTADNVPVGGAVKGYYIMSAMTADTATLTLSATYSGTTITKVFTVTKAKAGYEIVGTLPVANLFQGRTVFLTTDNKLYRYTGSAWVTSVPAVDISGTLADTQIAGLAASKITGQLTNNQLEAIAAAKLTGQIVASQITAGTITADQIAGNTITAAKIAGGTITANEIAGNTITGAKIAATTITAGNIVSNTITATQIAGTTITANEIASGTITGAKIAGTTITAANIATNTITANRLTMSNRSISIPYILFTANPTTSTLSWNTGYIAYRDDTGAAVNRAITAGSTTLTNVYVYWVQGATSFSVDASQATATAENNILLGWYNGTDQWYGTFGETTISGNFIQTGAVSATKISVTNLQAVSAIIGTLRTATTGARTEIKDNLISVYDASNVLRVRMGIW